MSEMRALTIHQPWAAAIAYGTKRVENRTWPAPRWIIGQTIAIHAGKKPQLASRPPSGEAWPGPPYRMHLGAVIAVATVTGCHLSPNGTTCQLPPGPRCSPWAVSGQYHWLLDDVRPLADPVPIGGAQSLWPLPAAVLAAVEAQLARAAADA